MDLKSRVLEGELMDAPDLDAGLHQAALKGLHRVNALSGTAGKVASYLSQRFSRSTNRVWRILDLASGGGDVTLQIAQRLLSMGYQVQVEGWDRSATAIEHAQQNQQRHSQRTGMSKDNVQFLQRDLFDPQVDHLAEQAGQFDVIMCTLFLHHLNQAEATSLLSRAYAATTNWLLVDDLRRTWLGYRLAQLGCHVLTRSRIVHVDGPLSVRAAFTIEELKALSAAAGLPDPQLKLHWPQRFMACWQR